MKAAPKAAFILLTTFTLFTKSKDQKINIYLVCHKLSNEQLNESLCCSNPFKSRFRIISDYVYKDMRNIYIIQIIYNKNLLINYY